MVFIKILILSFALLLSTPVSDLYAEEGKGAGYADVSVVSNYVWRGQKLSDNTVIQPSLGITYGGFGANLWGNYDTDTNEHNETDLTLNYEFSLDKLSIDGGYIYYAVDGPGSGETQEIYFFVGYEVLANLGMTFYYDFDEGDGAFIDFSAGHSFKFFKENTLNLGANIGYNINNKVMGTDKNENDFSNFYNGEISLSVTMPVRKVITIKPMIAYTFPLSNDARDAIEEINRDAIEETNSYEDSRVLYGGITVLLSF